MKEKDIKVKNRELKVIVVILAILVIVLVGYIGIYANLNKTINFDRKKCINSDFSGYDIMRSGTSEEIDGLIFSIEEDERNVRIQVRYDMMYHKEYSEEEILAGKQNDDIQLQFDKEVEYIFGGIFGPDYSTDGVFLFLLEDGSVEYMNYSDIYYSNKYEHKPVNGVNDIVRFDNISFSKVVENDYNCGYTIIAYKIDGTYYDLSEFINK